VIATLGGWPWTHYVLGVTAESARGAVVLRIAGCRVLRSRELRPPALGSLMRELAESAPAAVTDLWLHPGAYFDVRGRHVAPRGWRVRFATSARPHFEPAEEGPPSSVLESTGTSFARLIALGPKFGARLATQPAPSAADA
jgi:hypothetical protein